ncbi:TrmH family RNA methyltransferase [Gracilibacillus alcaliphilus]|uniref:TrmH family RNA methyltransferase n=1 Tax=Gracilibacillus alcaliphilus TaxID=1401441 RepID=UPI001955FE0C|nr:RNA methyltransferase [Gracilibacillus alcaliphilus]MBM7676939.1 TrmH family RNA methyltransferase [Gracilibacillus alcaliphilus]
MLTSVKNEKVKNWRKLHKKKTRDQAQAFLIEGFHLIEEAHCSNWEILEIIYQADVEVNEEWLCYPHYQVSDHVMEAISETKAPQGIMAVVAKKDASNLEVKRALLVDQVQDPGNLGTMIRTADAAGFDTVILGNGTVDLFNDKVIRSTQGSLFHLQITEADLLAEVTRLKQAGVAIWSTGLDNARYYHDIPIPDKLAIIVGNEGAGVSPQLMELADQHIKIPIYGQAESLNVSIAAAILMYEAVKK